MLYTVAKLRNRSDHSKISFGHPYTILFEFVYYTVESIQYHLLQHWGRRLRRSPVTLHIGIDLILTDIEANHSIDPYPMISPFFPRSEIWAGPGYD